MKNIIIDIGTKACKILIANKKALSSFTFDNFSNYGNLTLLGKVNNDNNILKSKLFNTIATINEFKIKVKKDFNIEINNNNTLAVGTAVFRNANNGELAAQILEKRTGIKVNILSDENEAKFSMIGAIESMGQNIKKNEEIMLIDQGGASTEISFASYKKTEKIIFNSLQSLDIGTVELQKSIFNKKNFPESLDTIYDKLITKVRDNIKKELSYKTKNNIILYGLGSGITIMTNKKGNRNQHGFKLDSDKINQIANKTLYDNEKSNLLWKIKPNINSNYPDGIKMTVAELYGILTKDKNENRHLMDSLSILLARIAFKEIMDHYKVDEVNVCGTGLRYGVFYGFNKYNMQIEE